MRAVIQRVSSAQVTVDEQVVGAIGQGLVVLVGVAADDTEADARWLASKVSGARVFHDEAGLMNRSVVDVDGELLLVSQFTLLGDLRRGRRPGFDRAMAPGPAATLFERFCQLCREGGVSVATGRFRAQMSVALTNEGPVTLLLDSRKAF